VISANTPQNTDDTNASQTILRRLTVLCPSHLNRCTLTPSHHVTAAQGPDRSAGLGLRPDRAATLTANSWPMTTEQRRRTIVPMELDEIAQAAQALRTVIAAIDAGEVAASETQRAYLAGAVDVLAALALPRTHE
jgi:hypothetical protein